MIFVLTKREFDGSKNPTSIPLPHRERGFETLISLSTKNISAPLRLGEGLGRGLSNSRQLNHKNNKGNEEV
ncbi:hypothetical protein NIES25_20860 [Nostoc linckia NIES-25]|nr:hypothetical protein NIES25_20860 [Nostoc linckia NIES-25]